MSSHNSPRATMPTPVLLDQDSKSGRGSLVSPSGSTTVDKEQLAQALDKIHSAASHSETLTTFNEFASPPSSTSNYESKGIAGDLMQNGLSGLYSRFRGAVIAGKERIGPSMSNEDQDSMESLLIKSTVITTTPRTIIAPTREESLMTTSTGQISTSSSRIQSPTSSSFAGPTSESQSQVLRASRASLGSITATTPVTAKSNQPSSGRASMTAITKTTASAVVPTVAPINVNAFKDGDAARITPDTMNAELVAASKTSARELPAPIRFGDPRAKRRPVKESLSLDASEPSETAEGGLVATPDHEYLAVDGSIDIANRHASPANTESPALSSLRATESTRATASSNTDFPKRLTAIDRITHAHLPSYQTSRASSTDHSIAETNPINTSAHNIVRHGSFSVDEGPHSGYLGKLRIPGTTTNQGAPEIVSARLEQMRKQVLSKEFWMADEICKECFLCGDTFSAFRRKHHCRTCGCIFDSKCTSIISGQRFGVQGSLRVCKTCLDIINRRHDSSGSDDSADDATLPTFFQSQQAKYESSMRADASEGINQTQEGETTGEDEKFRPLATPMMAIPATRRIGDSANRRSAVLEIDAHQLSRPSSSRSLKALSAAGRPPSSGHKRYHSKHNFMGRFRSTGEERAPFHRGINDDIGTVSKLPAFHDDNIIDPDLAPYMSDEGSSGNEQMSIFATMNSNSMVAPSFENDRSGFGSLLGAGKRHRARTGEKSVSGVSFTTRGVDDFSGSVSMGGFSRPNRRRNLSAASNNLYYSRTSPRQQALAFGNLDEEVIGMETSVTQSTLETSKVICNASMREAKAPAPELNNASLKHVRALLQQLLEDANISNISSWERALVPILLRSADDVNPNVRGGDDIDIRHYVKLKKIPGGKPGDTAYVSGVVFTKNLALKSMPRTISNPRIVIVSFPIEYQKHQQHFMSLEPVIAQEKEFLRNMVNRIASLRPQLLLVQKHISGLALQYLAEANIAVAYNVKKSVIEAVSRCAQTEIISSIDMVALKPVHIGKSACFDLKTYVHKDIPGKKKTYIYLSGCPKDLGCTIVLRGANISTLSRMKRIAEFMVYVVYNLKLETCLMRDEFVLIPSGADNSGSSPSRRQQASSTTQSGSCYPIHLRPPAVSGNNMHVATEADRQPQEVTDINISLPTYGSEHVEDALRSDVSKIDSSRSCCEDKTTPPLKVSDIAAAHGSHEDLPEDIPMPTFYSDMVAKHQTKILSASPFVKFVLPYLLMRAREQERRLVYLKRLRDQNTFEDLSDIEKSRPQKFQLIRPEMVHETVKKAPRQIMEVLHAVHDAEYDKALHNYQTQKRQWENYIQGNLNLFDPYAHQRITVLYTVVCTATSIPCTGPELLALVFYNEHAEYDPDCTLGQYVEDLCMGANTICASNGCERKMSEHHRTYVHGEARITVFVEKSPCKIKGLQESILMWSYCKICQKETQIMPMSESTWKYSLGKYLELSFWSSELRLRAGFCSHDIHRDHLRYFGYRNFAIRIHYDPIDLLEIIVPRTRITWKVDNDLRLKNEIFTKFEEKWNRFMASVRSRIKRINIDSVAPEKAEACKAEVDRLTRLAQEEHGSLIRKLQQKYMESKYYEIIPLNRAVRAMQEKVAEWDDAFADFDANFFPSEKDIRRLAALQLKKMFIDRDEHSPSIPSAETGDAITDFDEKTPDASLEWSHNPSNISVEARDASSYLVEETPSNIDPNILSGEQAPAQNMNGQPNNIGLDRKDIDHLDLTFPKQDDVPGLSCAISKPIDDSISMDALESESHAKQLSTSPLGLIPSEKVEKLRRTNPLNPESIQSPSETSGIPRPTEGGSSRRSGTAISPPLNRTQSQSVVTPRRAYPNSRVHCKQSENKPSTDTPPLSFESLKSSTTDIIKPPDKKLSERLGIGTMKAQRKAGHSLIPRSVHSKRKDSKVSTLAKHFEQLSREFEKERLRDRKQRAAKLTQPRAFPKASSRPIVEVYKDVNEAVEERDPANEALNAPPPPNLEDEAARVIGGIVDVDKSSAVCDPGTHSLSDTIITADETATETEDNQHNVSQTGSDDDAAISDVDNSLLDDIIPGAAEIAESLGTGKPNTEIPLEIPKHHKSSLMKMLTNFWAERSASGWTPLEYPMNAGDHIFADVDVIVREDEPSSLIAFALQTQDYKEKLADIRSQGQVGGNGERPPHVRTELPDTCEDGLNQAEVETSLLRATGTHLAYSFVDGSARMQCKIFFAEQFDAVRRKCGVSDRIVESLSRCLKWDSKGGKTKSVFLKTLDDRLVLKSLSLIETAAFLKFAPAYFNIMAEALFHDLPTVIAKMLGFYQIIIKNPTTGTEIKWDVLVMENLFYDRSPTRIFDLKGSMRNRKIQSTGEQNEVLLDENMVEFIYESPLFTREHSKKLLRAAIFNDTLFLQRNDVMDYSLMIAVDEARKELVVGIIDVVRTYTWDKKLESWIKDRGFAGGGRNRPTVTSPKEYKSRFREAMNRYILQAPNSWHQWQQIETKALRDPGNTGNKSSNH